MHSLQRQPAHSPRRHVVAASVVVPPTVILYSLGPQLTGECVSAAKAAQIPCSEVKHLQAACETLRLHKPALLVATMNLKFWDRAVVEEHAAQAGAHMRWVSDTDLATIGTEIGAWATGAKRPPR